MDSPCKGEYFGGLNSATWGLEGPALGGGTRNPSPGNPNFQSCPICNLTLVVDSPCQGELENSLGFRKSPSSSAGKSNPNLLLRSWSMVWAHNLLNLKVYFQISTIILPWLLFHYHHWIIIHWKYQPQVREIIKCNHTMNKRHKSSGKT